MKQKTHLREEMKRDLMKVYREVCLTFNGNKQYDAYRLTVTHPAPRFYVDAKWAMQRVAPMLRGDRSGLENVRPLTRQMYEDLFEVVVELSRKERFYGASTYHIIRHAVMEPAPRFYIEEPRMRQIWQEKRIGGKEKVKP